MIKKIDANKYGVVRYAISSIEDIADLPREVSVGSEAILVNEDGEKKFKLGSDGWVEVVEVKEYDEDKLRDMLEDAKVGYGGIEYETLEERLDRDFDGVYSVLDNRTYVEYEGCRITAKDSLNGLQKETVVKGRTLQNLLVKDLFKSGGTAKLDVNVSTENEYNATINSNSPDSSSFVIIKDLKVGFKIGATYTVVFDYYAKNIDIKSVVVSFFGYDSTGKISHLLAERVLGYSDEGKYVRLITTISTTLDVDVRSLSIGRHSGLSIGAIMGVKNVMLLEGDYTQTPLEDLPFIEGIESVGDKSKNLFDGKTRNGYYSTGEFKVNSENLANVNPIEIKPNTYYTGSGDSLPRMSFYDSDMNFISYNSNLTTCLSPSNAKYMNIHAFGATYFQVEEGTQATPYESYYDGYKISGKSCGKNLWKPLLYAKANAECEIQKDKVIVMGKEDTNWNNVRLKVKVKRNTDYFLSFNCDNPNGYISCRRIEGLTLIKDFGRSSARFNSGENEDILFLMHSSLDKAGIHVVEYNNIQLEEATTPTPYEPYKESTYSYILDEPLRSLPNGVCDEIDLEKGVVTRRVGRVVLDGTKITSTSRPADDNFARANITITTVKVNGVLICDSVPYFNIHTLPDGSSSINFECICSHTVDTDLNLVLKTEKVGAYTVTAFSDYLKNNPMTVYYELANPTTEYLIKGDKFVTLPNGVKDEVGRIVTRNVGKIVFDGSRVFEATTSVEGIVRWAYSVPEAKMGGSCICSMFNYVAPIQTWQEPFKDGITVNSANTTILIYMDKYKEKGQHVEEVKALLDGLEVYYELETPYMECSYEKYPTLPNGVKDEISHNSVLRKVGKIVLDGSSDEKWEVWGAGINFMFMVPITNLKLAGGNPLLCDAFKCLPFAIIDEEGVYNGETGWMGFKISRTKLKSGSIDELREWLALNPITVWCELETPYTEPINPNEVILDTIRLKSYEPITHITSDNYLPPTIKTQVPSDFNAVVLGLKSNNEALASQVMSLRQTNDELETTNREQDDVIDVTLLALDEVYGMIDEGEIEAMSMGSPMVNVYVKMIKRGIKTLDEVPTKYRAEVEKLI